MQFLERAKPQTDIRDIYSPMHRIALSIYGLYNYLNPLNMHYAAPNLAYLICIIFLLLLVGK